MKKCVQKLMSLLLALSMVFSLISVGASAAGVVNSGSCGENLTWTLTSDGTLTISGTGEMSTEAFTPWYDQRDDIKTIIIEDGITSVSDYAFSNCINLERVSISNDVTAIGNNAFYLAESLTSIVIPDRVTYIGDWAFAEGGLANVTIGDSVKAIGDNAFRYCDNLTSITIPDSVTTIGDFALNDCGSLTSIFVSENNHNYAALDGVLFDKGCTKLIQYPAGKTGAYKIPNSVTSIGVGAFYWCEKVTAVYIPDSVTSVDLSAFHYCPSLIDVYYAGNETQWNAIDVTNFYGWHLDGHGFPYTDSPCITDIFEYISATIHLNSFFDSDPVPAPTFTDVATTAYYAAPVSWAVANNVTNGLTDTTFGPEANCTRGQIVTFLWRAMGSPEPETTVNPFTDVKESDYYYKAVLWAFETGVTTGATDTTFNPAGSCTRAQAVTFLWRAEGTPAVSAAATSFTDVGSGSYYETAVSWAVANGITNGMTQTTFGPNEICNRGQIVTFLYRDLAE